MALFVDVSATGTSYTLNASSLRREWYMRKHISTVRKELLDRIQLWCDDGECILNTLVDIAAEVRGVFFSSLFSSCRVCIPANMFFCCPELELLKCIVQATWGRARFERSRECQRLV